MNHFIHIGNALVHPDHVDAFKENQSRIAYSRLDSCILHVAQSLSLLLNDRMIAGARPQTPQDIDACFDTVHDSIGDDVLRFGYSNDSIGSVLQMPEVVSVLPQDVLDDYRVHYRAKVLATLDRILPHYRRAQPDDGHLGTTRAMIASQLGEPDADAAWREDGESELVAA